MVNYAPEWKEIILMKCTIHRHSYPNRLQYIEMFYHVCHAVLLCCVNY